jgi:hypothetical protein
LQTGSSDQQLVVAADERFFMSGIDTLISATGTFLTPVDSNVLFTPAMTPAPIDPFAGGDRAVVVLTRGPSQTESLVSLVLLADGATLRLGGADQATGDPQDLAAFVTVAALSLPDVHSRQGGRADTSVQQRDAEGTTLLATSASLNRAVGQNPARPVTLRILPDPSGNQLAVVIEPVVSAGADDAVVVIDRLGHMLGVLNETMGPARGSMPAWSPDGSALAYYTVSRYGAALAVWATGGPVRLRVAPKPSDRFDGCIWAPDGLTVLCSTTSGAPQWIYGRAGGGRLIAIKAPVFKRAFEQRLRPVAWLP